VTAPGCVPNEAHLLTVTDIAENHFVLEVALEPNMHIKPVSSPYSQTLQRQKEKKAASFEAA
jgi:hypothetical protein